MIPALLLAATLAVGLAALRRTRSAADFFVAGRRLGAFRAGLAVAASAFSGFVFLGGPGLTGQIGYGSLFIVVPAGFTAALLCRTMGRRLALAAEASGALTLPEVLAFRFRGQRGARAAAGLGAFGILAGSVIYLGVQFSALALAGRFAFPGAPPGAMLALGAGVVLAYSLAGGMTASVNTDVLQGLLMAGAAALAFAWALGAVGGPEGAAAAVAASGPEGARLLHPLGVLTPARAFGLLFLFSLGTLGQPHMLHKFLMLKSPEALRYLPAVIGGAQGLSLLVWFGLGTAVLAFTADGRLAPLAHPDDAALAALSIPAAPALLTGLVAAAALAAIMSTSDAFLNLGAAALVRDLPRYLRRPRPEAPGASAGGRADEDRRSLANARRGSAAVAAAAVGVAALHQSGGGLIAFLGTLGFGAFAAALAPPLTLGLVWERTTAAAAALAMAVGLATLLALELLAPAVGPPPAATAMAAGFATVVAASLLSKPPEPPEAVRLALTL